MSDRAVRIAVVGAGPSAFYAAAALVKQEDVAVRVDLFDRLPAPYGLVRYGVAPDHQNIKAVTRAYARTAEDERVRFFGGVDFGAQIDLATLRPHYDMVVFAVGAQSDRALGVPGEDLRGSLSATEFVAWYNGHPDRRDLAPDLDVEGVAVIGVGNVAMDVARILAKSVDELRGTDIADHALEALARSRVERIHVLGRRGPAQAKFTTPEIREFGTLEHADAIVDPADLELDAHSRASIEHDRVSQTNYEILQSYAERGATGKPRQVRFGFLRSPAEIHGRDGRVAGLRVEKNRLVSSADGYLNAEGTGEFEELDVGMVLRSVGYRGVPLPGVPFDERRGRIPNDHGRVLNPETGEPVPGMYVVGWAKRGPSGVIGTNKKDAEETVAWMLRDLRHLRRAGIDDRPGHRIEDALREAGCDAVTFDEWRAIDAAEVAAGEAEGRPRRKFVDVAEMRAAARG